MDNDTFKAHRSRYAWLALAMGLAFVIAACGGSAPATLDLSSHTPSAGASGVLLSDAIELTFSAAIDAARVTAATLKVLDGGNELSYDKDLSSDGKTLSLTLTSAPASLPATLTVQIDGITGAAGGAATASFSFTTAGDWVEMGANVQEDAGNDADHPSIAFDANGRLVVAYDYALAAGYRIAVRRWSGSAWESIGAPFNSGSGDGAQHPDLALDSTGNPVAAWVEYNATNHDNVFVRRWDGSEWKPYSSSDTPLDLTAADPTVSPAIVLASNDAVSIAFLEQKAISGVSKYRVYHGGYVGGIGWAFHNTPDNSDSGQDALGLVAAINSNDEMILAWVEDSASGKGIYVKNVVNGFLGSGPLKHADNNFIPSMDMELNPDGNPVVAWREQTNGSGIYARYWDGSAWQNFGGSDLVNASGFNMTMALDSSGYPVIAYSATSGASTNLLVTRWDGSAWVTLPGTVNLDPAQELYGFDCAVDADGFPVVVWSEDDGSGGYVLHAARYNGLAN